MDNILIVSMMKQIISYDGYAIVGILQTCVSFNKRGKII